MRPFVSPTVSPFVRPYVRPIQPRQQASIKQQAVEVVNYAADRGGCGHWRLIWPEAVLNLNGLTNSQTLQKFVPPGNSWYTNIKCIRLQRQVSTGQLETVKKLYEYKQKFGYKLVYESDDVVFYEDIPEYNMGKPAFASDELRQNAIDIINLCDEVTVTCPFMRDLYREKTGKNEVTVVPNFPPYAWMGHLYNEARIVQNYSQYKQKPRIMYTGSTNHFDVMGKAGYDDFSHVVDSVRKTVNKFTWVFIGTCPPDLVDLYKSKKIEVYPWQSLFDFPRLILKLNPIAMIAPLNDNNFNKCKSDIRFIEACTLGIPCVVQNIVTYDSAPNFLKFNTGEEMIDRINSVVKNRNKYLSLSKSLHEIGDARHLELKQNYMCHFEIATTPYNSAKRQYLNKFNS